MNLIVTLMDKPGALMHLTDIFHSMFSKHCRIDFDRNSVKIRVWRSLCNYCFGNKG